MIAAPIPVRPYLVAAAPVIVKHTPTLTEAVAAISLEEPLPRSSDPVQHEKPGSEAFVGLRDEALEEFLGILRPNPLLRQGRRSHSTTTSSDSGSCSTSEGSSRASTRPHPYRQPHHTHAHHAPNAKRSATSATGDPSGHFDPADGHRHQHSHDRRRRKHLTIDSSVFNLKHYSHNEPSSSLSFGHHHLMPSPISRSHTRNPFLRHASLDTHFHTSRRGSPSSSQTCSEGVLEDSFTPHYLESVPALTLCNRLRTSPSRCLSVPPPSSPLDVCATEDNTTH
ncbi:uncharacterized protein EI90DRAFT_3054802 [Cantharellus anzutake]|uniref:uncharacterized protein n=1 Tax=Cantharellus anzutake TaxID=1750568 RepID=UPI001906E40D|nr:uncharacterized protein EI90DRAFT_3093086 [Cantharellus anzutake]XP_038916703.1 uncharacterized protein EI90DRAFT_3054802 [Cantharellus anzutake]KAF8312734.1 hypothetical protein EI90DRAFT_3093086 [Cantharellus anzutake]KAF8332260.1 hypothetical protein EI90DRAFT_3054802 [Cantharellus anzutake]